MNRRSILKAATWGVPAATFASKTPAFATSEKTPHYCDKERCKPAVTCKPTSKHHQKKYPKQRWVYTVAGGCSFTQRKEQDSFFYTKDKHAAVTVEWVPFWPNKPRQVIVTKSPVKHGGKR